MSSTCRGSRETGRSKQGMDKSRVYAKNSQLIPTQVLP